MIELKQEAVKDVTTLSKTVPVALAKTKEVLNQAVADLYVARISLHQVHWYMRGRGFLVWHPKMDEYMEALDGQLDEISERLITLGGNPYSTLTEFLQHSEIEEEAGEYRNVEKSLERVLAIYRYLSSLFQEGLDATDAEGDDVTNGIFADAKTETDKTIWMLAAEIGQAPGL
ncbi:Dps family protein [Falseniella ignava]